MSTKGGDIHIAIVGSGPSGFYAAEALLRSERPITIDLDMDAIRLPGRDAVSFVVIVNELVTNAIKHAFPDHAAGRILIRFRPSKTEEGPALALTIEDDGVGMPKEAEIKGLGQTVITSLLRSMRATMTTEACTPGSERPGSRITLMFPKRL